MSDVTLETVKEEDEEPTETSSLLRNIRVSKSSPHMSATKLRATKHPAEGEQKINLADEIRGALIFHIPSICCFKDYTVRIYLHYWVWQIPVLIINIILFCIWNTTHNNTHATIALTEVGFLAVGPVFLCALVRDKIFLWWIYWCVKKTYFLGCTQYGRYHVSRLADCIGGLHSSLGVTAFIWNIIYSIGAFIREEYTLNIRTITAFCLPLLLCIICLCALPCIRHHFHNWYEIIHRYLNWLALCLLIIHVVLVNIHQVSTPVEALKNSPTIFTALLVILTVYPWLILHRIKGKDIKIVCAEKSTAFIFPVWSPMGAVAKLSTDWIEFHVMGITPLPYDESKGHYESLVLMKSLGDWSTKLNEKAKQNALQDATFYISRIKPPNFTQGLFNWNRVFVLVTGAGIAPLIPYVVHTDYLNIAVSLVWVARNHSVNYPEFIIDILRPIPNIVLYDTTKMPRPNLCALTVSKAKEFQAEAVFIVSNPKMAYHVANYVMKQGIPAFASNFDV